MSHLRRASIVALLCLGGCSVPRPAVSYQGQQLEERHPDTAVYFYRARHPPRPWQEMGIVRVACPAKTVASRTVGGAESYASGGCSLAQVTELMRQKALSVGADGLCMLETTSGRNGGIVSAMATVFRYLPELERPAPRPAPKPVAEPEDDEEEDDAAPAPQAAPKPSIEDRLKELQRLRDKGVVTKDEYARRRAEILKEL